MKNKVIPILLLFLLSAGNITVAQQLALKTYTVEEGLVQNCVYSVLQDHCGYMWFGTEGGLSKFDGIHFINYTTKNGLSSNDISCLYEDKKGNLWIGSSTGGVCKFDGCKFTHISLNNNQEDYSVYSVFEDKSGSLWFGTKGAGVQKIVNGKYIPFERNKELKRNFVRTLIQDNYGNIWFGYGDNNGGLTKFDGNKFTHYTVKDGLIDDGVLSLYEDSRGNIWVGTFRGISRFDGKKFVNFSTHDFPDVPVLSIFEDSYHVLWIATYGCGLYKLENGKISYYDNNNGFSSKQIYSIVQDRRGDLWIGTTNGGVSKLAAERFISFTAKEGLPNSGVFAINEDSDGNFWMATYGGGVVKWNNGKFVIYDTRSGLSDDKISSILVANDRSLWFGTFAGGVCRLQNGKVSIFNTKTGLANDRVFNIIQDRNGIVWIGTNDGVSRYDGRNFKNYNIKDGLPGNQVNCILEDKISGNIWLATNGGLSRFDGVSFSNITMKDGLLNDNLLTLSQDKYGRIWFGTDGEGSGFYDGNKIKNISTKDGLSSNTVYFLLADEEFMYIGTNTGINRIRLVQVSKNGKLTPKVIRAIDGLPASECTQNGVFRDKSGNIWFGTVKGVTKYYPQNKPRLMPPPIYITSYKIRDLDTAIVNGLVLKHDQNNIKFEYTSVSFASPEKTVFAYKLEGISDTSWKETDQRVIVFPNLSSGTYNFRIRARNSDGLWSDREASIEFEILPPFYLNKWFLSFSMMLALASVYVTYRYKTQQVQRRNIELALMVRERTKELEDEKNKSEELLHNILPGSTVAELKTKGFVQPREIKNISILFTDFKGFTYIAGMLPAEMLVNELNDIFKGFDEIIERFGVEKLKTIGDSYMVGAGLPEVAEDHAVRVIKVGMEMQKYIKERNKTSAIKWEMRAGVHSGSVIAGVVGKKKFSYDIWGDTVNIASRMESAGAPGEINISAYTYMLVKDYFECEYRGKVTAKGKGELDMYFVKGVKEAEEIIMNDEL